MNPPQFNPYESPQFAEAATIDPTARQIHFRAWHRLAMPAGALVVLAVLQLLAMVALGAVVAHWELTVRVRYGEAPVEMISLLILIIGSCLLTLAAGICMLRLRALRFCQFAAIVGCIPYLSPWFVIGIPFALWALWVLFLSDTRHAFAVAAQSRSS